MRGLRKKRDCRWKGEREGFDGNGRGLDVCSRKIVLI